MQNKRFIIGIIGVICLASIARTIHLDGSFWLDEAAQAVESARPLSDQLNIIPDFQPPLFHLLVHFWMQWGGRAEWWLRLTSVIPGLFTIVLTMLLTKKWVNTHAAYIAGVLLATSSFHILYSQELRPYSLAACFALLTVYAFSLIEKKPKVGTVLLSVSSIAGSFTTYTFPLVLITLGLVTFFWHRKNLKQVLISFGAVVVAWIPWFPTFLSQLHAGTQLAADFSVWSQIVSPPVWKMLPLTIFKFIFGRIPVEFSPIHLIAYAVVVITTITIIYRSRHQTHWQEMITFGIVPILLAFLISLKIPILDPKRVLFCLPFIYMAIAAGIGTKPKNSIILTVFLLVNMSGLSRYAQDADVQREPWREAVATISREIHPGDQVVFAFSEPFAPWLWYADPAIQTVTLPMPNSFAEKRYIVFDYLMDMTDPDRHIYQQLENNGYYEASFLQYPGIGKIRFFPQASPVAQRLL